MSLTLVKKPQYEFGDGLFSKWNAIHQQEGVKFEYQRKDMNVSAWQDDAGQLKITIPSAAGLSVGDFIYLCDDDGIYTPDHYEIDAIDGALLTLILPWNGEPSGGFANSNIRFPNYNVLAEIYTIQEDVIGKNLVTNGIFSEWEAPDDPKYWIVSGESDSDPEVSEVGADEGHGGAGTGACNIYNTADYIYITQSISLISGKTYLVEIEINNLITGFLTIQIGHTGTSTVILTEGIHKFIKIVSGNASIYITSSTPCDITIDNVSVREIGSSKELIFTPDTTGLVKVDSVSVLKMISSFVEESAYDVANIRDAAASGRFKVRVKEQWTGSSEAWSSYSDAFYYTNSAKQLKDRFGKNMNEFVLKQKSIDIKKLHYETDERGKPIFVLFYWMTSPLLYYYNKKTYGVWMQRAGLGYGVESMVYAIYHEENRVSASYGVGTGRPLGEDSHAAPAVIVADDGHIIVAYERLKSDDPNSGHPSVIEIKRSDNVEDETSWVHAKAKDANYYTTVGTYHSYPKLYKLSNGNIIYFARGSTSAISNEQEMATLYISTDHGKTFGSGIEVVDLGGAYYAYSFQPTRGITSQIDMIVTRYNEGTTKRDEVYYLKSTDGGTTWTDVAGGGSKNVVVSNALTLAELQANKYRICQDIVNGVQGVGAVMKNSSAPYIVIWKDRRVTKTLSIYEYSSGAWNEHVTGMISIFGSCNIDLIYKSVDNSFDIIMKEITGNYFVIKRKNALLSDLTDWTIISDNIFKRPKSEFWSLSLNAYTFNNVEAHYHAFARVIDNNIDYNDFYIYMEVRFEAKFLAIFNTPKRFVGYPWDISIIYSELLIDRLIILKEVSIDINGNEDSQYWTPLDDDEKNYINRIVPEKIIQSSHAFYDLSVLLIGVELLLNGTFDHKDWTDDDPDDWTVEGESGTDPEISEAYSYSGHSAFPGRDACNIYTTANTIYMKQDILTPGKTYLIEIKVTKMIVAGIRIQLGNAAPIQSISTEGIYRYIGVCAGNAVFLILNDGDCDVTIDNVSVKEYYDEIVEVKRIEIDQECKDNPVYLRWVNLLGAREYWLFSHHQEFPLEIDNMNLIERNISDIETAEAIQDIISKEAKESIIIGEDNLPVSNVDGMKGLLLSPLVQMLTNPASWESEDPKWKTVIVKRNTWNLYRNDRGTYNLELEIGLPRLNIQTR